MGRCAYVGERNPYIYRARRDDNPSIAFACLAKRPRFRRAGEALA